MTQRLSPERTSSLLLTSLLVATILLQANGAGAGIGTLAVGDFSISMSPNTLNINQGSSGTATVIVNSLINFSSPVSLSVSGLPSGVVAGFGSNPITPTIGGSASSPLIISVGASVAATTYGLTITGSNGTVTHSTTFTLKVISSGDFNIIVSPASVVLGPSTIGTATVTITSVGSFSLPVGLTAAGVPFGLTLSFGTNPVTPPAGGFASSFASMTVASSSSVGTYTITISGNSGTLSHSTTLTVTIAQTGYADFSITVSTSAVSVVQGSSSTTTLTLTSINGFNQPIGLSIAWVGTSPSGITFTLPTLVTLPIGGTAAATVTINAASTATVGTYGFRAIGTSATLRHSIDLTVQISTSQTSDFTISASPSSITLSQGTQGTSTVSVQFVGNFASAVTLTSSGTPVGTTLVFGSNPITTVAGGTVTTTATITTLTSAHAGTYTIMITGSSGSLSHSTSLIISVTVAALADFAITPSSNTVSVTLGSTGTVTIAVQSINGFNSAVDLSASWVTQVPQGVELTLPSPVTPLSDATATSILTITVGSSTSPGNFNVRVIGVSGSVSHFVDIVVKVLSQQCLIATATYGSEISPEVQFLRNFRDNMILKTYAGSNFMIAFNAWYYSFSPTVARLISENEMLRAAMKVALYPLVLILRIGAIAFTIAPNDPELGVLSSGIVISWLLGAGYIGVPLSFVFRGIPRRRKFLRRLERGTSFFALGSLMAVIACEFVTVPGVMVFLTSTLVVATVTLSALLSSRVLVSLYSRIGKYGRV